MALGVGGVRVGMWTDAEHHTGCTVILPPAGTVGGIAARAVADAVREGVRHAQAMPGFPADPRARTLPGPGEGR